MANLPDPVLDKLRCYMCNNFLSCKPISIDERGQSLCGRCKPNRPTIPAHTYECVAEYFLFPCKNWEKHCAYLLNIKDVLQHEKDCSFGGCCSIFCFKPDALFKPDNKLDLSQSLKFYKVPDQEVLAALTCSLCGFYLSSSPIHVNAQGYNICHRCHEAKGGQIPRDYVRHAALQHILEILLFPCVYHKRGCTKIFRFGYNSDHEQACSYSRTQQKTFSTFIDPNNGKQKGVIETHTGHMYGTITPFSQFFSAQNKVVSDNNYRGADPIKVVPSEKQELFFNQLLKHRDSLQYQWHRNSKLDGLSASPRILTDGNNTIEEEAIPTFTFDRPRIRSDTKSDVDRQDSYKSLASPGSNRDEGLGDESYNSSLNPLQINSLESDFRIDNRSGKLSPSRNLLPSTSSASDTLNSRGSASESICSQPTPTKSPLKLNPTNLMHSNSFNYAERAALARPSDSFSNNQDNRNYSPQVHQNNVFRY